MKSKLMKSMLNEYDEDSIKIANKTARTKGSSVFKQDGSLQSITANYVINTANKNDSILDFGSGPQAVQTNYMKNIGFENVTAYDFGSNMKDGIHDPNALHNQYDVVFASNVLNVASNEQMIADDLNEIWGCVKNGGRAVFNYPSMPRKSPLNAKQVEELVVQVIGKHPTRVGGSPSAPLWELVKGVSESLTEGSDSHYDVYDEIIKENGYTDEEIAKVISIADEYEKSAIRGIISRDEIKHVSDLMGLESMSDSELRKAWDLYYYVLSRESFTDDDNTGIEKYKKYNDAASAFAEVINSEARKRKASGNYNPDLEEDVNAHKYDIGYVKTTNTNHPLVYGVSVEGPYTNSRGDDYKFVDLHLLCGWDYVSDWSDKMGWADSENFVDNVQSERLVCYDDQSPEQMLEDEGYEFCEKPKRIYHYNVDKDRWEVLRESMNTRNYFTESKLSVREYLNKLDHQCLDNGSTFYDLRSLYEGVSDRLTPEDKQEVKNVLNSTDDPETIAAVIMTKADKDKDGKLNEDADTIKRFNVGDTFSMTGLYGGSYECEVIGRTKNSIKVKQSWIAEDTGDYVSDVETYPVEIDNKANSERLAVWEYRGEKGYVYPEDEADDEFDWSMYESVCNESSNTVVSDSKEKEIFAYLDSIGGYNDYNGKIEAIVDEFGLSKDRAERLLHDYFFFNPENESLTEAAGNKYDIRICDGNGAASRGSDVDHYKTFHLTAPNIDEALKRILAKMSGYDNIYDAACDYFGIEDPTDPEQLEDAGITEEEFNNYGGLDTWNNQDITGGWPFIEWAKENGENLGIGYGFEDEDVYLESSLSEDTIKQNGKWVNKGKEGTHGKFATKKEADAQRKAMFANGYKENLDESKNSSLHQHLVDALEYSVQESMSIKDIKNTADKYNDNDLVYLKIKGEYYDPRKINDESDLVLEPDEDLIESKNDDSELINYLINRYSKDASKTSGTIYDEVVSEYGPKVASIVSKRCGDDRCFSMNEEWDASLDVIVKAFEEKCRENHLYISECYSEGVINGTAGFIYWDIEDGDWKHEHLRSEYLMRKACEENNASCFNFNTIEIGESDSDTYSAHHRVSIVLSKDADIEDEIYESLNEDYTHKNDDWGDPYSYEEVEDTLSKITNNFIDDDAVLRCYYEQEKNYGIQILKKHYKYVDVSDGRTGPGQEMSWVLACSEPFETEE